MQLYIQPLKARKRVHIIHLQQQYLHVMIERIFTLDIYSYYFILITEGIGWRLIEAANPYKICSYSKV